jgi:hypothetical protein
MLRWGIRIALAAISLLPFAIDAGARETTSPAHARQPGLQFAQARKTCKQVSSCREAVILWCSGYRRADGDSDGIPCENVCPSKELVDQIRREIGC